MLRQFRQFTIDSLLERALGREEAQSGYAEDRTGNVANGIARSNMGSMPPWSPQAPTDGDQKGWAPTTVHVTPAGKKTSKKIKVNVANTPALRKTGLQNTADATAGEKYDPMLFTWPDGPEVQATLHNAGVNYPVSAHFFDSSGMWADSFLMQSNDGTPKTAKVPHRHALEIHPDDADALGLGPGSSISIDDSKDQSKNGTIQL